MLSHLLNRSTLCSGTALAVKCLLLIPLVWLFTPLWVWDFSCSQPFRPSDARGEPQVRWRRTQEHLEAASETGRGKSPPVPALQCHHSVSSADRTGHTAALNRKCCSSLRILRVVLIFSIIVSVSLSSPNG